MGKETNQEVAHKFAQNRQLTARAGNMSCHGTELYSYTTLIAKWYGDRLVSTSFAYSLTTVSKHYAALMRALPQGITHYRLSSRLRGSLDWDGAAWEIIDDALLSISESLEKLKRTRKAYTLIGLRNSVAKCANTIRDISVGMTPEDLARLHDKPQWPTVLIVLRDPTLESLIPGLSRRIEIADEKERNANLIRAAREEKERAERITKETEALKLWRLGLPCEIRYFTQTAIRINGDKVETTKGATVTLETVNRLLPMVLNRTLEPGTRIDEYTFSRFEGDNIIIGCHVIPLSELAIFSH